MDEYVKARSAYDWIMKFEESKPGHKVSVTHNTYDVMTQNTYKQHRCYRTKADDMCKCECIDSATKVDGSHIFNDGGQQGTDIKGGYDKAKEAMPNQDVHYGIHDPRNTIYNPQRNDPRFVRDGAAAHDQTQFWDHVAVRQGAPGQYGDNPEAFASEALLKFWEQTTPPTAGRRTSSPAAESGRRPP